MKILITGGCGFVGSNIAIYLKSKISNVKIDSLDNLSRKGSVVNYNRLKKHNIKNYKYNIDDYKKIKKIPIIKLNYLIIKKRDLVELLILELKSLWER